MGLKINFMRDFAACCRERLKEAGYCISTNEDREVIRIYLTIRHRRVINKPRSFHQASYAIPAHLVSGHEALRKVVERGDELWPYQSRKILKSALEDGMLNDFGIQHFHLGIGPDLKHAGLISGTRELLFAVVNDADFYAIGIYDHLGWSCQMLLDAPFQIRSATGQHRRHGGVSGGGKGRGQGL